MQLNHPIKPALKSAPFRLFALGVMLLASACLLPGATSLTQFGITWTWQEDRTTGQFANGDYWVIGPITLTGISPASVVTNNSAGTVVGMTAHGSMINPVPASWAAQGFDSRFGGYNEALNIARQGGNPLSGSNTRSVAAGSSICSSISRLTASVGEHALLNDFVVLTVLASAPAPGSFRPPYVGGVKTITHNKSELDYGILKNLTPVAGMSAPTSAGLTRPWAEIALDYNAGRDFRAYNNQPEYDRDAGAVVQNALLELHQNYPNATKELAYVRLVQYGIDVYGAVKFSNDGVDTIRGGVYAAPHGSTYAKVPLVLAALALDDADMKFYANAANKIYLAPVYYTSTPTLRFHADGATAYVNNGLVGVAVNDQYLTESRPRYTYTAQMLGLPEWGGDNGGFSQGVGSNFNVIYRNVRYYGMIGNALGMQLTTGAKALWNWPAFFDYFDRAYTTMTTGPGDNTPNHIKLFWNAYRSQGEAVWTRTPPVSGIGWIPQSGTTLTIEYTDNVATGSGGNGGLVVTASSGAVTATYASGNGTTQRTFTLSRAIAASETVTYTYTQPGNGVEATTGGLDVATATGVKVVNYSTAALVLTPPSNAVITITVEP